MAAYKGRVDVVRVLLALGRAEANRRNDLTGSSPLTWAVQADRLDVARVLLQLGADPDVTLLPGGFPTPLFVPKSFDMLRLLVEEGGADIHRETGDGSTVLMLGARFGNAVLTSYLAGRCETTSTFNIASTSGIILISLLFC